LQYITDSAALAGFCDRLREHSSVALDTEFTTRSSYFPRLRLTQLAAGEAAAVVDCYQVKSLGPLLEILYDPGIEKVVHAGRQDLAIFARITGKVPQPVFDTMLAAALVGYGPQVSYQALVERITGKHLSKTESTSDWERPVLTRAQLRYALEDVLWLPTVAEHLKERLASLGRAAWSEEEQRRLVESPALFPAEPEQQYLRIKDRKSLTPRAMGVLREMAAWRERVAQREDRPRGWIIKDEVLVTLARRAAGQGEVPAELLSGEEARYLPGLREAAKRGLAHPEAAHAAAPPGEDNGLVELTTAFVRSRCLERNVAPTIVATRDDLEVLCRALGNGGHAPDLPLLEGWRRELVGEDLLALLSGRLSLWVSRPSGRIRVASRRVTEPEADQ